MYLTNYTEPARLPDGLPSLPPQLLTSVEQSLNLFIAKYAPAIVRPDNQEMMAQQRVRFEAGEITAPLAKVKRPDVDDPNIFAVAICKRRRPDYQSYIFAIQSGTGRTFFKFYFMLGHDETAGDAMVSLGNIKKYNRDGNPKGEVIFTATPEQLVNDGFIVPMPHPQNVTAN
jgi:hypothetical protein